MLGAINGQLGRIDDAITCCQRVIALQPGNADAHYNLAQAYMHQCRHKEAVEAYRDTVRLQPQRVEALNNLGYALQQIARFEEAVACHKQALSLNPEDAEAFNNLGNALHGTGNKEAAEAAFLEALRIRPDYETPRFQLAVLRGDTAPPQAPPDYVRGLFDNYAERFDQHLVENLQYRTPELLNSALRQVLGAAESDLEILDLGCGTGLCGPLLRDLARKLVGVDLSPKMIEKARARNLYDELLVGDITASLLAPGRQFDLVVAADVFPYVGDLVAVFAACASALKPGGLFAFSVEASEQAEGYILRATGRYAHSAEYIMKLADGAGFVGAKPESVTLRMDKGKPISGYLFILRRYDARG